jgi:3-methyladenine DNA glycosylase/8-oxoguanine DNA glycosylase
LRDSRSAIAHLRAADPVLRAVIDEVGADGLDDPRAGRTPTPAEVLADDPAVGDLGIRRAVMVRYGLPALPGAAELEQIAEPWRPYRTLACRYLWRSLRNEPA